MARPLGIIKTMSNAEEKPDNQRFDPPAATLIIDNDHSHADTVAETLERIGFHCRVATSGKQGAKLLEESPFDLVITDLVMNDIDGLGILSRAKDEQPDAEVILMTGHGTVASAVEAMRNGRSIICSNRWTSPSFGPARKRPSKARGSGAPTSS